MDVYKVGMSFYSGMRDRNSGLYEVAIIEHTASRVPAEDFIVVISGLEQEGEYEKFRSKYGNKSIILVVTDEIFFGRKSKFIDDAVAVLTQTWEIFENINAPQLYSYVPELFFSEVSRPKHSRLDIALFAGGLNGREKKFEDYRLADSEANLTFPIAKFSKDEDDRIDYIAYMSMLPFFKYSLVFARESYNEIGWVTARIFESICNNVIPLVDSQFDKYRILDFIPESIVVSGYQDVERFIASVPDGEKQDILRQLQDDVKFRISQRSFIDVLKDVVRNSR